MPVINYLADRTIMVMARGHPYNREDFFAIFDDLIPGMRACAVEQPACQHLFSPAIAREYAAFVLYDMPGLDFQAEHAPAYVAPGEQFKHDFLSLLEQGHGFVFLHHSLAAWPAWPEYADIVGGRFFYRPGQLHGKDYPSSGYRHDVSHTVTVVAGHPVTAGVSPEFQIVDELYLAPVIEETVIPLLRSNYQFTDDNFYSAELAVAGKMYSREGWQHPPGSNLIGWAKHYRNSPIVYLQCGDGKAAYQNSDFRRLLANAINWVGSRAAKDWAREQNLRATAK